MEIVRNVSEINNPDVCFECMRYINGITWDVRFGNTKVKLCDDCFVRVGETLGKYAKARDKE